MTSAARAETKVDTEEALVAQSARLIDALRRINRSLRHHATTTLTLGNLSALAAIVDAGRIRPGDLALREGIAPATISRIIGHLEQAGLIARHPDPNDGRSYFLAATDKGAADLIEVRRSRSAALLEHLQHLDTGDRTLLFAALPALESLAAIAPS